MLEAEEFPNLLNCRLLQGTKVRVYHVSTRPSSCPALFAPGPGRSEAATTVESHFLAISQPWEQSSDAKDFPSGVLVLAIEVLIFTTSELTTVFVSKADSTGLLVRPAKGGSNQTSLTHTTITAFLEFLLSARLDRGRLVLSLFARSQNQYLFPGSIENVTKHVLDDRQLIRWWCRVLDPLVRWTGKQALQHVHAHIVVPGCDIGETKAFFPPSAVSDSTARPLWRNGYPVDLLVRDTSLPARCLVPRPPDDPKSRFLDDLDTQCDSNGNWRGIKTLDQFWDMMSHRQECSAGRLVGFVWVVFTPAATTTTTLTEGPATTERAVSETRDAAGDRTLVQQQQEQQQSSTEVVADQTVETTMAPIPTDAAENSLLDKTASNTSSSCVKPGSCRQTAPPLRNVTACSDREVASVDPTDGRHPQPSDTTGNVSSEQSRSIDGADKSPSRVAGGINLSADNYHVLMDEILHLDFAGKQAAMESTDKWCKRAIELAGAVQFGIDVEGAATERIKAAMVDSKRQPTVNILTAVRKKRKVERTNTTVDNRVAEAAVFNDLATDLVRKKPRT